MMLLWLMIYTDLLLRMHPFALLKEFNFSKNTQILYLNHFYSDHTGYGTNLPVKSNSLNLSLEEHSNLIVIHID